MITVGLQRQSRGGLRGGPSCFKGKQQTARPPRLASQVSGRAARATTYPPARDNARAWAARLLSMVAVFPVQEDEWSSGNGLAAHICRRPQSAPAIADRFAPRDLGNRVR